MGAGGIRRGMRASNKKGGDTVNLFAHRKRVRGRVGGRTRPDDGRICLFALCYSLTLHGCTSSWKSRRYVEMAAYNDKATLLHP